MIDRFFKSVEEAGRKTKSLLWPVQKGIWLRLFLLFALTGGWGSGGRIHLPNYQLFFPTPKNNVSVTATSVNLSKNPPTTFGKTPRLLEMFKQEIHQGINLFKNIWMENKQLILTILGLGFAILCLLMIVLLWLGCRMKLVLIKSLLTKEVLIKNHWRDTEVLGEAFFWFQIVVLVIIYLPLFGAIGWAWISFVKGLLSIHGHGFFWIGFLVSIFAYLIAAGLVAWPMFQFLPIYMVEKGQKPLAAIKQILAGKPLKEYLIGFGYLLLYFLMVVGVSIAVGIVGLLVAIPSVLLLVVLGAGGYFIIQSAGLFLKVFLFGLAVLFFILFGLFLSILFIVPTQTFFGYLRIQLTSYLTNPSEPS